MNPYADYCFSGFSRRSQTSFLSFSASINSERAELTLIAADIRLSSPQQSNNIPRHPQRDEYEIFKLKQSFKSTLKLLQEVNRSQKIKELYLESRKFGDKLHSEDMKSFSKIKLPSVVLINLTNNDIRDQGLKTICDEGSYPSLQKISLNDNSISVVGVSHLIHNKWPQNTKYDLDTVKTLDQGYAFQVGESVPTIKRMQLKDGNINDRFLSQLQSTNQRHYYRVLELLMIIPLEGSPIHLAAESKELQLNYDKQIKQSEPCLAHVMMALKDAYGSRVKFHFCKKSSLRTKISSKLILCGADSLRTKIVHRFTTFKWNFYRFQNNNQLLKEFQSWCRQQLARIYGGRSEDIILHKITQGSIKSQFSYKDLPRSHSAKVIPFFQEFALSAQDFDSRGDFKFPDTNMADLQYRGGLPYYQPVHGKRFGINVLDLYDNGNNDWLTMNGNDNQWAVAFHGINKNQNQMIGTLQSMMNGRESGRMLRPGPAQVREHDIAVNKTDKEKVGKGVYCSPLFTTCLCHYTREVSYNNIKIRIVLQCRIRPKAIKITKQRDYWVINQSKDIRPYGIVVFTSSQQKIIQTLSTNLDSLFPRSKQLIFGENKETVVSSISSTYSSSYTTRTASKNTYCQCM